MRAAYIEQTGPPEAIKVGELPRPKPGPGQVLVKVGATALNPIDLYVRSGFIPMPLSFPYIIGCDLAGTVEEVGPGATRFKPGDRVWGSNQGLLGRQGVTAEFAAVDEDWLYPDPRQAHRRRGRRAGPGRHHGAPRPVPVRPARRRARRSTSPAAAAGSARWSSRWPRPPGRGWRPPPAATRSVKLCQELGADLALNYKTDDIPARLREFAPEGVDVWYETQREPNLEVAIPLLRKRGRMILMAGRTAKPVLPLGAFYPRNCALLGFAMFNATPDEQRRAADDIVQWAEAGRLKPLIGRVYPLAEAAKAEKDLEENTDRWRGDAARARS